MKLRTEMLGGGVRSPEGYFLDEAHLDYADGHILLHDAMAAHALEDARNKMGEEFAAKGVHGIVAVAVLAELDRRADEILASWGVEKEVAG